MKLNEYVKTLPDMRREKMKEIARETVCCERSVERWIYGQAVPSKLKREAIVRVTGLPEMALWRESADGSGLVSTGVLLDFFHQIPTPMQQLRSELSAATGVSEQRVRMWMSGFSAPSRIVRKKVSELTGLDELEIWPSLAKCGKEEGL